MLQNSDVTVSVQGRVFTPGDFTKSMLLACGGHITDAWWRLQASPLSDAIYLYEQWLELREMIRKAEKAEQNKQRRGGRR